MTTTIREYLAALDLVSLSEIGRRAGVSPSAVSNWRKRYGDFPSPVLEIGTPVYGDGRPDITLWTWEEVERWLVATLGKRGGS